MSRLTWAGRGLGRDGDFLSAEEELALGRLPASLSNNKQQPTPFGFVKAWLVCLFMAGHWRSGLGNSVLPGTNELRLMNWDTPSWPGGAALGLCSPPGSGSDVLGLGNLETEERDVLRHHSCPRDRGRKELKVCRGWVLSGPGEGGQQSPLRKQNSLSIPVWGVTLSPCSSWGCLVPTPNPKTLQEC